MGLDFEFDETADRPRLKLLNIFDEHTREALALRVERTCNAEEVVAVIERLVAERGAPGHLRMENGLLFGTSAAWPAPPPPTSSPAPPWRDPLPGASTAGSATSY